MSADQQRIRYSPNRRQVLIQGAAGALAVSGFFSRSGSVFASVPGASNGETPGVTEGPYWVDGQVNRSDVRTDSVTGVAVDGFPLVLDLTLSQISDSAPYTVTPLVGARVDIWSCNAQGVYSDVAQQSTTGTDYLRGYQVSDANGAVQFGTIIPGWYSGRTAHIHMRVRTYDSTGAVAYNWTSQLFFDDATTNALYTSNAAYARTGTRDTTNATDGIYSGASQNGSPDEDAGDYLLLSLANDGTYGVGAFHIVLDLEDATNEDPTGGSEAGAGGFPPGGAGGTPPGGFPPGGTPPTGTPPTGGTSTGTGSGSSFLDRLAARKAALAKARADAAAARIAKAKARADAAAARLAAARARSAAARAAAQARRAAARGK
mgnify:CR=1 FL=1